MPDKSSKGNGGKPIKKYIACPGKEHIEKPKNFFGGREVRRGKRQRK